MGKAIHGPPPPFDSKRNLEILYDAVQSVRKMVKEADSRRLEIEEAYKQGMLLRKSGFNWFVIPKATAPDKKK